MCGQLTMWEVQITSIMKNGENFCYDNVRKNAHAVSHTNSIMDVPFLSQATKTDKYLESKSVKRRKSYLFKITSVHICYARKCMFRQFEKNAEALTCFAYRLVYMLVSHLKENRNTNKHLGLCLLASTRCPALILLQEGLQLVLRVGLSGLWESIHNSAPDALVHLQNTFYQTYRTIQKVL